MRDASEAITPNTKLGRGNKTVSVVMAAFNEYEHIGSAIESVIKQSFEDWELIVVDDGSSDSTFELSETYAAKDSRIRLVRNMENLGLPASLNRGIKLAHGCFIARADADDINLPMRFESQVAYFERHPEVDALGTAAQLLDIDNTVGSVVQPPESHAQIAAAAHERRTIFFHSSVMMRREFFHKVGLYSEAFPRSQDRELWLRGLAMGCHYRNLPNHLIQYRTNGYRRTWKAIFQKTISMVRLARLHENKKIHSDAALYLARGIAIKMGLYKPKALRSR